MVIWMTEILKEYIYNMTFWQGVISSIVIALFIKSGKAIINVLKNAIYCKYNCSLQGYWLTAFKSFSQNATVIEIYKISQKNSELQLNIQHYSSNNDNSVSILRGKGVVRRSEVACYYTINNKNSSIVGGLLFQIKRCDSIYDCLSGKYVQLNNMSEIHKNMYGGKRELEMYIDLYRLEKLDVGKKNCLIMGKELFKNYSEAYNFAEKENKNGRFYL